jgi:hypothetical protein
MNAEGRCSASARPKDYRRIAHGDEARHEQKFAKQARRSVGHQQEDKKAGPDVSPPFTASHAVKPVDGDGELGIPKSRDAVAGSHRKRDPMNTIPTAIRPESKYPVRTMVSSCHLH